MSEHPTEDLTLSAYGEPVSRDVEAHLNACARCAAQVKKLRETTERLDSLPQSQATFLGLLSREIRKDSRPRFWRRLAGAAAAAIVIGLGVYLLGRPDAEQPARSGESARVVQTPVDPAARKVEAILASLDALDEDSLRTAAQRLGHDRLLPQMALARILRDSKDTLRQYVAIRILRYMDTPAAEEHLAGALGEDASRDRFLIRALVEMRSRKVTPVLVKQLKDPRSRSAALRSLGELRDPSSIKPIASYLAHEGAARTLTRFRSEDLVRHGMSPEFVAVPNEDLQRALLRNAVGDAAFRNSVFAMAGVEFLVRAHGEPPLRKQVLLLLRERKSKLGLARCLDRDELRDSALEIIASLKLTSFLPEIMRRIRSRRIPVGSALCVLARLGDRKTLRFVLRQLSDELLAVQATRSLQKADPALLSHAAGDLLRSSKYADAMVETLSAIQKKELGAFFLRAMSIRKFRSTAIRRLGALQYESAVPALIRQLRVRGIAIQATLALKEITGKDFGTNHYKWTLWWRKNS